MTTSDGGKPLDVQIGGDHYKSMAIQPMEYSMANKLDACQHTIIKYVTRFRDKGGIQDLEKAKHCIDLLIHFEQSQKKYMHKADEALTVHPVHPAMFDHVDPEDVEIASAIDDSSGRMQAIGQNGNGGEHYGAPDWSNAPDNAVLYIDWTESAAGFDSSFYCDGGDRFYRLHHGVDASTYVLKREDGLPDIDYPYYMRPAN